MLNKKLDRRGLFTQLFRQAPQGEVDRKAAVSAPAAAEPAAAMAPVGECAESAPLPVARLQPAACLAYRGTVCSVCVERCPVPGAIAVQSGRPSIVRDVCTGCGDCVARCPAPVNALSLEDRA